MIIRRKGDQVGEAVMAHFTPRMDLMTAGTAARVTEGHGREVDTHRDIDMSPPHHHHRPMTQIWTDECGD